MEDKFDWLNNQIENMQADMSLLSLGIAGYEPDDEDLDMLKMAAWLNASRPSVGNPDETFVGNLRARMLSSVVE